MWTRGFPAPSCQSIERTHRRLDPAVVFADVDPLAVDRLRGRCNDFADLMTSFGDDLEDACGTRRIGVVVRGHVRGEPAEGRLMEDLIDALQHSAEDLDVAYVTLDELGFRWNPRRPTEWMGLLVQVVENPHAAAELQQRVDDVRADEPGASRYENSHPPARVTAVRLASVNAPMESTTRRRIGSVSSGNIGSDSTCSASLSAAG